MEILFLILFIIDAALHLFTCLPLRRPKRVLRGVTKALLMPLLIGCYYAFAPTPSTLVIAALACGCVGDVLLLFPGKLPLFAAGLSAFAVGHVLYIIFFLGRLGGRPPLLAIAVAILVYAALIVLTVYRQARYFPAQLAIPCCLYLVLISTMSLCALLFCLTNAGAAPVFACVGSVLFMASDYILSDVTFRKDHRFGSFSIMGTYILAQSFIAFGCALYGGVN